MKNKINTFYLLDTQEALDASNDVLKIQLTHMFKTLSDNSRLKSVLDKNPDYKKLFDDKINDNARIRFWLTCTKELIKSLNSDLDPSPSSISCLFVDSLSPGRVIELHLFELLGIWIDDKVNKNMSFSLSFNIIMPNSLKLGSLGNIDFSETSKEVLTWDINFNCNDSIEFCSSNNNNIIVKIDSRYNGESDNIGDSSIITDYHGSSFEIPIHDNALCEPYYANAAIVRSKAVCERWCNEVLIPAMDILYDMDEKLIKESLALAPIQLPLHSGSIGFGSASSEDILGLIYLPGVNTKYDVSECLLHETLHQKLFRIETAIDFFEDQSPIDEKYYSPWRIDPRPLRMLLHGAFVFTAISEMWSILAGDPEYDHSNGDPIFLTTFRARQSIKAIDIIKKYGVLNQLGEKFIDSIYNNAFGAIDKVRPSDSVNQDVEFQLKDHNDRCVDYIQ
jgi:hypothetical protein